MCKTHVLCYIGVNKLRKKMFSFADILLNTSRYSDIDNTPVHPELGEIQMYYVVIRHDE